jgi:Hypothetical glycosyl hydrolase family 15
MRPVHNFLAVILTFSMLVNSSPAVAQKRGGLFPDTTANIHLEMVFNYSETDPNVEAGVVDMVWGSSFTTPASVYNTFYIPYSVDDFFHTLKWYKTHHPDWLEYQCDRKTLAFEFGAKTLAPLDVTNPDVRAYQWSNWVDAPLSSGYAGIVVDTLTLTNDWGRCGHYDSQGNWVQQYSGGGHDARFRRDVLSWEAATYAHVHNASPTATMQVNYSYQFNQPAHDNLTMMTRTDLLFDERGYTNWGTRSRNVTMPAEWAKITDVVSQVQAQGVCYMTNGEEPEITSQISQTERLWVIANYLLVKNHCTYMYMSGFTAGGAQDYGRLITFPEYSIAIGHAVGDRLKQQGIWVRQFSGGWALVNPLNRTAIIKTPDGSWVDVNGAPVGPTITMPAQTGFVLLAK